MPRVEAHRPCSWPATGVFANWPVRAVPALAAPGVRPARRLQHRPAPRPCASLDTEARRREEIDPVAEAGRGRRASSGHYNITVDWLYDPARQADSIFRSARSQGGRPAGSAWASPRRLAALQLDRAGSAPSHAAELRAVPQRGRRRRAQPCCAPRGRRSADNTLVRPDVQGECPGAHSQSARSRHPDGNHPALPSHSARVAVPVEAHDPDVRHPADVRRPAALDVRFAGDPDGLIAPTFAPTRRFAPAAIGDADDLIDPTRTTEVRSIVPARW